MVMEADVCSYIDEDRDRKPHELRSVFFEEMMEREFGHPTGLGCDAVEIVHPECLGGLLFLTI